MDEKTSYQDWIVLSIIKFFLDVISIMLHGKFRDDDKSYYHNVEAMQLQYLFWMTITLICVLVLILYNLYLLAVLFFIIILIVTLFITSHSHWENEVKE